MTLIDEDRDSAGSSCQAWKLWLRKCGACALSVRSMHKRLEDLERQRKRHLLGPLSELLTRVVEAQEMLLSFFWEWGKIDA